MESLRDSCSLALCCPGCGQIWYRRPRLSRPWHFICAPCPDHDDFVWQTWGFSDDHEMVPGSRLAYGWIDLDSLNPDETREELLAHLKYFEKGIVA